MWPTVKYHYFDRFSTYSVRRNRSFSPGGIRLLLLLDLSGGRVPYHLLLLLDLLHIEDRLYMR